MDPSLYLRVRREKEVYLLVYEDDVLLVGSDRDSIRAVSDNIAKIFNIRLQETVDTFLWISCDFKNDEVVIHIKSAVTRFLQHFLLGSCQTTSTPLPPGTISDKSIWPVTAEEKAEMQKVPYMELIGWLLYLANTTRQEIAYVVGLLPRYVENPVGLRGVMSFAILRELSRVE